jgi:hypothetical protein
MWKYHEISIPNSVCLCFGTINVVNPKTNLPFGDGLYNIIQPIYDDFGWWFIIGFTESLFSILLGLMKIGVPRLRKVYANPRMVQFR